ncbi:MAG TPA: peroxiredoxin [Pyrinomonadaceae bacterium]|nr:peroxiredoxin [Pyrinomonadaceae bacterium]
MSETRSAGVGSQAPDFTLPDGQGTKWRLSDHRGKTVVLLFYPGDETPICTKQLCSVRDRWEDYSTTGAVVVGISTNSVESHRSFADNHSLPLTLLADIDRKVIEAYDVESWLPNRTARSVVVIDPQGIVSFREVHRIGLIRPKDDEIIEAIKRAQKQ